MKKTNGLKGFNIFIDEKRGQFLAIMFQAVKQSPEVQEVIVRTAVEDFDIATADIEELYAEIHKNSAKAGFTDSREKYGMTEEELRKMIDEAPPIVTPRKKKGGKSTVIERIAKENRPANDGEVTEACDMVTRLSKNMADGFYIIAETLDQTDDSVTNKTQCKLTQVNKDLVLRTVLTALDMDKVATKFWVDNLM